MRHSQHIRITRLLVPGLILACGGDKAGDSAEVERSPWDFDSVVGVSNMDDDDQNGTTDWDDADQGRGGLCRQPLLL